MISASVSSIALTYGSAGAWNVFNATNLATAGNLQANFTDIASQINESYQTALISAIYEINNVPSVRVYNSTVITATNLTLKVLPFDSERYDTNDMHSTAVNTSRLTCNGSGVYSIGVNVEWTNNVNGDRQLYVLYNGSAYIAAIRHLPGVSGESQASIQTQYYLSSGDYVEAGVRQTAGIDLNVLVNANYSPEFYMAKIG
jgi:hypothetical protein